MRVTTTEHMFEFFKVREDLYRLEVYTWPDGTQAIFDAVYSRFKEVRTVRLAMTMLDAALARREMATTVYCFSTETAMTAARIQLIKLGLQRQVTLR